MPPTPLQRYLRVQRGFDAELDVILEDAAKDAERLIKQRLKKYKPGDIRTAQLRLTLREIHRQQRLMWGTVGKHTEAGMARAAVAAADAESAVNALLFRATKTRLPLFAEALRAQAEQAVKNVVSKGANGIPLSAQVYKTNAWSNGLLDRKIKNGLILNKSAAEIARDVSSLISPDVPGGVSYAAKRLGRTELNNAFHRTEIDLREEDPWVQGFKWNLSGSHPRPDKCNEYAQSVHERGRDAGVYGVGNVPGKPHPQCLCYLTTITIPEEEFIAGMASGKYDRFINEKLDFLP